MGKSTLIAIAAGLLSLMAALPALKGTPGGLLLFYVAGLPIYMAGLAFGATAGTVASLSGFIAAATMGSMLLAGVFALVHLLPAWAVVGQAMLQRTAPDGSKSWYPPGHILSSLTGIAAMMLLLTGVSMAFDGPGLSVVISERLTEMLAAIAPNVEQAARDEMVRLYGPLLPASAGSSWVVMAMISAVFAQGVLAKFGKNLRPTPIYSQMTLPDWVSWTLVASALIALVAPGEARFIARNLTLVMAVPFFLLGLAVIHQWARRTKFTTVALTSVYLFLFIAGWLGLMVAAAIGVLEQWAGLRKRMSGPLSGSTNDDAE